MLSRRFRENCLYTFRLKYKSGEEKTVQTYSNI